ncbi:MAG: helix-turn-helix domain-containing protein [Lachnospiraceae bacterium]|nr:helix-turn-helix domain-containing protein [Lachnospiraceae bacterium]
MESVKYHGVALGGKIYSLRMAKRMSQEQLAAVLSISPAAISKWERNLSKPSIEMLWTLADFFECSIDELVGRTLIQVDKVGTYDEKKLRLAVIGDDLLKCSEISRLEGLLAMESYVPELKSGSKFLAFAIPYIMNLFMKQAEMDVAFGFLENYVTTLPKEEQQEGKMVAAVLRKIFSGESPVILQELIASYIGIDYREKNGTMSEMLKYSRQEILNQYNDKKMYSDNTNLLEEFIHVGDFEIQSILRNMDNLTLTTALVGASGDVAKAFMANLSDRLLYLIHEDMKQWTGTEEEILTAQKKVLELGSFCLEYNKE